MTCRTCNGIGLVDKTQDGVVYAQEVCEECAGTGLDARVESETVTFEVAKPERKASVFRKKK